MTDGYKLVNGQVEACADPREASRLFEFRHRQVAKTTMTDGTVVSTVFLVWDHGDRRFWESIRQQLIDKGAKVLFAHLPYEPTVFETMAFVESGPLKGDDLQHRCKRLNQAMDQHSRVVGHLLKHGYKISELDARES